MDFEKAISKGEAEKWVKQITLLTDEGFDSLQN